MALIAEGLSRKLGLVYCSKWPSYSCLSTIEESCTCRREWLKHWHVQTCEKDWHVCRCQKPALERQYHDKFILHLSPLRQLFHSFLTLTACSLWVDVYATSWCLFGCFSFPTFPVIFSECELSAEESPTGGPQFQAFMWRTFFGLCCEAQLTGLSCWSALWPSFFFFSVFTLQLSFLCTH